MDDLGEGFVERIKENNSYPHFAVPDKELDMDLGKIVYKIYSEGRPSFADALLKIIPKKTQVE